MALTTVCSRQCASHTTGTPPCAVVDSHAMQPAAVVKRAADAPPLPVPSIFDDITCMECQQCPVIGDLHRCVSCERAVFCGLCVDSGCAATHAPHCQGEPRLVQVVDVAELPPAHTACNN